MTQNEDILNHMRTFGAITPREALQRYGTMRLASRINELKQHGIIIEKDMLRVNGKHFASYKIVVDNYAVL